MRAEAGLNWGEFDAATQEHGLAVTGGRVPDTGIVGLALGSGSGWLERKLGFTCDNLLGGRGGHRRRHAWCKASATENAELFWALRGGGGNFGIVTAVLPPAAPDRSDRLGGMLAWPAPWPVTSCGSGATSCSAHPTRSAAALAFITAPPADFVPEPVRGHPVVGVHRAATRATPTRARR